MFNFLVAVKVCVSVCTDVARVNVGVIYSHVVPLVVVHLLNSEIRCHQCLPVHAEAQAPLTVLVPSNPSFTFQMVMRSRGPDLYARLP